MAPGVSMLVPDLEGLAQDFGEFCAMVLGKICWG